MMITVSPKRSYKAILSSIVSLFLLLLPAFALAAFDDVVFQDGGEVTAGGITLTVNPVSNIEKIEVNANNFVLTMAPGSSLKVTAANLEKINHDADPTLVDAANCTASESFVVFDVPNGHATNVTITVTPSSTLCSSGAGSGGGGIPGSVGLSSGGGGGGGGDSSSSSVVSAPKAPVSVDSVSTGSSQTDSSKKPTLPKFSKILQIGMTGAEILNLQILLNSDPDTIVSATGPGSPGQETDYFGNLTRFALRKFQAKHGIVSSGDEGSTGYGLVGPKTRVKLNELISGGLDIETSTEIQTPPTSSTANVTFTKGLSKGQSNDDIRALQILLNSDPDTLISATGPGSPGQETDYFGSLTEKAVQRFQEKHNIAEPGNPGYGYVGPKTRAKLNSI